MDVRQFLADVDVMGMVQDSSWSLIEQTGQFLADVNIIGIVDNSFLMHIWWMTLDLVKRYVTENTFHIICDVLV